MSPCPQILGDTQLLNADTWVLTNQVDNCFELFDLKLRPLED